METSFLRHTAHRQPLPGQPLPFKCECLCDEPSGGQSQLCTLEGGQKAGGVWDTWTWGSQVCQQQYQGPDLQELGNRGSFLCKSPFFYSVIQSCSPPGFNIPFQAFCFLAPFESFQPFLNPDPRPLFVKRFLFLPHYLIICFSQLPCKLFLPSLQFAWFICTSQLVFLSRKKKCRGSRKVLYRIKGMAFIIVLLYSS